MTVTKKWLFVIGVMATFALIACSKVAPEKKLIHPTALAWVKPVDADMKPIFAAAKANNKPMFVYWGAVWCPPCNQVKSTVFNRPDFIERSQAFIPVYIDGDSPGAQKIGNQFKVRGYPTMILFAPDGSELTRLPGEIDAQKYLEVLDLALQSPLSVKASLQLFSEGQAQQLTPQAWRQLAYYAWDQDQAQLVPAEKLVQTLRDLTQACPTTEPESATRLFLKMVVVSALESRALLEPDKQATTMLSVLQDSKLTRQSADVIINYGADMVKVLRPDGQNRVALVQAFNGVLEQLSLDQTLSKADRLGAIGTKLALAKLSVAKDLDPKLKEQVRQAVLSAERSTTDVYERQALIPSAADLLSQAGFADEAYAMLEAELPKAIAPYYHMLVLAANAKARGDQAGALNWAEKAWKASQGPATRLQWGSAYVSRLLELTPTDTPRIEAAASGVLAELAPTPETFYHRNRRSLEKMGQRLRVWGDQHHNKPLVHQLAQQLMAVCAKLPENDEALASCQGVFKAPAKPSAV